MFRFSSANRNKSFLFSCDEFKKGLGYCFLPFTASSYELGNRAASVTGTNVIVCSLGKFQPGRPGCSSRNKTKIVEHN